MTLSRGWTTNDVDRFWSKVERRDDEQCWLWRGTVISHGYGHIKIKGRHFRAHRVAFRLTNGYWPEPCCLHECDTPLCVNPRHLSAGTVAENNEDMRAKNRHAHGPEHALRTVRYGEESPRAVLTWAVVRDARRRHAAGETVSALARDAGVSRTAMQQAIAGQTWRDEYPEADA